MAIAKDISDCKEKEEKLQLREAYFKTLFENVPDAMVIIDAETGKFVDANARAVTLFGLEREKLIGIGPLDISPPVQSDGRASEEMINEKIQDLLSESPQTFEWVHRHSSGRDILCEIRHTKLPIPERKLYCAMAIVSPNAGGWDVLREKRAKVLKDLGIITINAKSYPRLPSVKAWQQMAPEERAIAARDMEVYAAMVDYMDEQINRIIEWLKKNGAYDNTLILFFSDNGANGHSHKAYPGQTDEYLNSFDNRLDNRGLKNSYIDMGPGWAQASMAPRRMFKAFPSEGGIASPMIVKTPGKMAQAGSLDHTLFHVRDIMPTVLDLAGVGHPGMFNGRKVSRLQGQSVLDLMEGKASVAYAAAGKIGYELFGLKAFIDGAWKILWMPKPFGKGDWELFNRTVDPAELNDLSMQQPAKRKGMVALWEQYKLENGVLDISMDLSGKKK